MTSPGSSKMHGPCQCLSVRRKQADWFDKECIIILRNRSLRWRVHSEKVATNLVCLIYCIVGLYRLFGLRVIVAYSF